MRKRQIAKRVAQASVYDVLADKFIKKIIYIMEKKLKHKG
jgi:hypothetical protein